MVNNTCTGVWVVGCLLMRHFSYGEITLLVTLVLGARYQSVVPRGQQIDTSRGVGGESKRCANRGFFRLAHLLLRVSSSSTPTGHSLPHRQTSLAAKISSFEILEGENIYKLKMLLQLIKDKSLTSPPFIYAQGGEVNDLSCCKPWE